MKRGKVEEWWRKTIAQEKPGPLGMAAQGALLVCTLPYGAIVLLRGFFYATKMLATLKVPVPVVSFGNITAGGGGKTPAAIWCAKRLLEKGIKPGIASRGYNPEGRGDDGPNDEAMLLKEELPDVPHVWDADRAKAAGRLVKEHGCSVVILDDGFQHRRLHRTLDIVLVDALNPFGYGYLMPRGLLREPPSALRRATHIVITRSNLVSRDELVKIRQRIRDVEEGVKLSEAVHQPVGVFFAGGKREDVETLRGRKVYAFCGIANPQAFLITLSNLGATVVGMRSFGDHHIYSQEELGEVWSEARERSAELVVTTQKDRVKCGWREGAAPPLAEVRVEFELVRGKEAIESALDFIVKSLSQ